MPVHLATLLKNKNYTGLFKRGLSIPCMDYLICRTGAVFRPIVRGTCVDLSYPRKRVPSGL